MISTPKRDARDLLAMLWSSFADAAQPYAHTDNTKLYDGYLGDAILEAKHNAQACNDDDAATPFSTGWKIPVALPA